MTFPSLNTHVLLSAFNYTYLALRVNNVCQCLAYEQVCLSLPAQPKTEPAIPVILTAKERRKIRRQNRQERDKEESEKVRLGLKAPPEPKGMFSSPEPNLLFNASDFRCKKSAKT